MKCVLERLIFAVKCSGDSKRLVGHVRFGTVLPHKHSYRLDAEECTTRFLVALRPLNLSNEDEKKEHFLVTFLEGMTENSIKQPPLGNLVLTHHRRFPFLPWVNYLRKKFCVWGSCFAPNKTDQNHAFYNHVVDT